MTLHKSTFTWLRGAGLSSALTLIGASFAPVPLAAALFLDPAGGVAVVPDSADDGTAVALFWSDSFFGSMASDITTISTNGFIRFGNGDGDGDYFLQPLGTNGVNRIAPMWMDFNLGESGQILTQFGADDAYLAVTWQNMENVDNPGAYATFQAILFNAATVLNGVSFGVGDIVFSYGDLGLYYADLETIIGLETAAGATAPFTNPDFVGAPEGWHMYSALGDFPVGENEYVLFQADGNDYNVSIQSAIPEPASAAAMLGGLALAAVALRRRR
ncbi:MAG: PEP-CTERM sorting domain-containing protein [Verrucomicrobiota bacterium]